jgi:hypothetical protein
MRIAALRGLSLFACLAIGSPCPAADAEEWFGFDLMLRMSNRFNYKANFLNTEGTLSASQAPRLGGRGLLEVEDPLNLRFNKDELGYSGLVGVATQLRFGSWVGLRLSLDSGELKLPWLMSYSPRPVCGQAGDDPRCLVTSNGQPVLDEAAETFFVREAFLEVGGGRGAWFTVQAGKLLLSTGNGFIMDNYALGVATEFDLDLGFEVPLELGFDLVFPDGRFNSEGKRSPYLYLDVAYQVSFFEEIGLFFAWYHDGDDNLATIMYSVLGEALLNSPDGQLAYLALSLAELSSRGDLFWVGLRTNWLFARSSLSATAMLEFGAFDYVLDGINPINGADLVIANRAKCLGGMLDVQFHYDVADWMTLGAFFLFLSGETFGTDNLRDGLQSSYSSFISVYPYITHTNIFFSGGMNQNFSARSFSTSGVNGRGVIAPGLTAGIDLGEDVTVRLVAAGLLAHGEHLTSGGRFYGLETDLNLEWTVVPGVRVLFEADYFFTGNFFDFVKPLDPCLEGLGQHCPTPVAETEPGAFKIMVGLDLVY